MRVAAGVTQAGGRTADDAAYWLAGATPAWRDAVQVVAIGMCTIYLSAVMRMLPRAKVAVDLFHVGQLAVKTAGDVRRRAIRDRYGRRGKAGGPEYGIMHLLERNQENLGQAALLSGAGSFPAGVPGLPFRGEQAVGEFVAPPAGEADGLAVHAFFGEAEPGGQRAAALVGGLGVQGDAGEAQRPECLVE